MDEGMPWGIIMIFFLIGALLGIRAEINKRKREDGEIAKPKE
jgi:hypothetical protein